MEAFEYIERDNHPDVVQIGMFTHIETHAMAMTLRPGDKFIAIGHPRETYKQWEGGDSKYYLGGNCARMKKPILFTLREDFKGRSLNLNRWHLLAMVGKTKYGGYAHDICWKLETLER